MHFIQKRVLTIRFLYDSISLAVKNVVFSEPQRFKEEEKSGGREAEDMILYQSCR